MIAIHKKVRTKLLQEVPEACANQVTFISFITGELYLRKYGYDGELMTI